MKLFFDMKIIYKYINIEHDIFDFCFNINKGML